MILSNHVTKFDKLSCKGADTAKDFEWTTLDLQTARWTDGKIWPFFSQKEGGHKNWNALSTFSSSEEIGGVALGVAVVEVLALVPKKRSMFCNLHILNKYVQAHIHL